MASKLQGSRRARCGVVLLKGQHHRRGCPACKAVDNLVTNGVKYWDAVRKVRVSRITGEPAEHVVAAPKKGGKRGWASNVDALIAAVQCGGTVTLHLNGYTLTVERERM